MDINKLVLGEMGTNVYLLVFDNEIFVIDPASQADLIRESATKIGKPITHVLLTHGHFDHCNAAAQLQKDGAKVLMSMTDYEMIQNGYDLARYLGTHFNHFVPDEFLEEGDLTLNGHDVKILTTPGHTAGSLTYVFDEHAFCGDTLFYLSVGRADLPTGDKRTLVNSVKKLYALGDKIIYPGHGKSTTLEFERLNNPYVKA